MRARRRARRVAVIAGGLAMMCSACASGGPRGGDSTREPADSVSAADGSRRTDRDGTGAVSVIGQRELDGMRGDRIEMMIAGRVPGLEVIPTPSGYFFRIRGAASLMGTGEALCIIDGVPIRPGSLSSALDLVMPQDIARIEVLKDAGAAAAYGSRGANGVIVITTRRRRD